jgi:hypothetical protein
VGRLSLSHAARPSARASARLAALRFVLDCHARKEAAPVSRPDDAGRNPNDSANDIIPRPS